MFHEYTDLADRTMQLHQYLNGQAQTRTISDEDHNALNEQLLIMGNYCEILGRRLTAYFNNLDYTF